MLGEHVPVVIFAATGLLCLVLASWQVLWVRVRWARAARAVQLESAYPIQGVPSLAGRIDGVAVTVKGDMAIAARAVATSVPHGLSFRAVPFSETPIESSGDPEFDRGTRSSCGQRPDLLAAILDANTRELIWKFVSLGGVVQLGAAEISGSRPETATTIALAARRAARIVSLLSRPLDVPAALAKNAQHDPLDTVRAHCLRLLIEHHAGEVAATACRSAMRDASPAVRLMAAAFLRAEGLTCLLALVSGKVPIAIASKAIAYAAAVHATETAAEVRVVIRAGFAVPALVAQAIHSAALVRWWEGVEPQLEAISSLDSETLTSLVTALARFPDRIATTEPHLLSLLESTDPGVRRAAAKTLGEIGTVAAVAPLLPMSQTLLGDLEMRTAALTAIRAIQSRQAGAGAGQLSLGDAAASEEGALALVTGGGELAIAAMAGGVALAEPETESPRPQPRKTSA